MASVEVVSGLKKRKSSKISSRRKKTDNKLVLRRSTERDDGPLTEKSVICFHRHSLTGLDAFYLFNFEDKADQQKGEEDYRYRIKHGPYGLGRSLLPPVLGPQTMPFESKSTGKFAALGSNIYHIGGYDSCFSKKVYRFDTCNPDGGWTEVAPLIRGGHSASVAVLDNKIYVMRIFSGNDERRPWGQIYDPVLNKWSPMPELPSSQAYYLTHLDDEKTILVVVSRKILYGFKVKSNSWVKFDENFEEKQKNFAMGGPLVAVNRCLYRVEDDELFGYDLEEGEVYMGKFGYLDLELRGIVRHPGENTCSEYAMEDKCKLIALGGGKLCLIWQHDKIAGPYTDPLIDPNVGDSTFYWVYCVKFQVSKVIRPSKQGKLERILNISIESSKSFLLKGPGLELGYVRAM
ncbi:hypothetical protein REPUB_Repub09cG0018000 [Reevesia pubescens]